VIGAVLCKGLPRLGDGWNRRSSGLADNAHRDAGYQAAYGARALAQSGNAEIHGSGDPLATQASILAGALLRLQCLEHEEASGEAAIHASESGETRTGGVRRSDECGAVIATIISMNLVRCRSMSVGERFRFALGRLKVRISSGRQHRTRPCKNPSDGAPSVLVAQTIKIDAESAGHPPNLAFVG